ncbi:MAG: FAD:protein FMN transferase [Actinomycetota bacterium]
MTTREIEVWGSVLYVDVTSSNSRQDFDLALSEVADYARHIDTVFSTYKADSTISQLRRNEISIDGASDEVKEVWNLCGHLRELTDGAFDPWSVVGGFDPSGLVKGWAADKCSEILLSHGAEHIQVNAAGDLTLRGGYFNGNEISPWSIGVVNPNNRQEIVEVIDVMDGAIATSGTYERGAHIHDPHTGLIAIGAKSATVVGSNGAIADALATALMVEGRDGARWFGRPELVDYSAFVIDRNEDVAWSLGKQFVKQ